MCRVVRRCSRTPCCPRRFGIAGSENTPLPTGLENPTLCDKGRVVVGSPGSIAPEILEGGEASAVSDVFALASVCLAVCPALAENRKISSVLSRALAGKPQLRQESATEFAAEFEGAFRSRRGLWIGGGLVAGAIVAIVVCVLLSVREDADSTVAEPDVQEQLAAYAQEMTNIQQRIAMKNREIRGPLKGLNILSCTDAEEQIGVSDKVVAAQDRFFKETLADKKRYHELLKRSARLKFNCGIPLTDAEARAL